LVHFARLTFRFRVLPSGEASSYSRSAWEVWNLEDWSVCKLVEISYLMTQTSETFRVLQSTTCSRTTIEPVSRCVRGT
jgi:hypothetical protein